MVAKASTAVVIHGRADGEDSEAIWIGCLDEALGASIGNGLRAQGLSASTNTPGLNGTDPSNVCNRTRSGCGVQLEIPKVVRNRLCADRVLMRTFACAVRASIGELASLGVTGS